MYVMLPLLNICYFPKYMILYNIIELHIILEMYFELHIKIFQHIADICI